MENYFDEKLTVQEFFAQAKQYPRLTESEFLELLLKKDTDMEARNKLVNCNLRLVGFVVSKLPRCQVDYMDLIIEGTIGLIQGINKYDATIYKDQKPGPYLRRWIEQRVKRAMIKLSHNVNISYERNDDIKKVVAYIKKYEMDFGEEPSDEAIALHYGYTVEQVREFKSCRINSRATSLDNHINGNDDSSKTTMGDFISSDSINDRNADEFSNDIENVITMQALTEALDQLDYREQIVIARRFGLGGVKEQTLAELAETFGVSKEAIRQTQIRALEKLRKAMED